MMISSARLSTRTTPSSCPSMNGIWLVYDCFASFGMLLLFFSGQKRKFFPPMACTTIVLPEFPITFCKSIEYSIMVVVETSNIPPFLVACLCNTMPHSVHLWWHWMPQMAHMQPFSLSTIVVGDAICCRNFDRLAQHCSSCSRKCSCLRN